MSKRAVEEIEQEEAERVQSLRVEDERNKELPRSQVLTSSQILPTAISVSTTPLLQRLKALYSAQDTLPKLIEDASVPEQRMDDYYVKLQIVLNDKKSGDDKQPITLAQMFEQVGEQSAVGKVLITGIAGIGKTTFLNHISYEWSKGKAFNDKFDYVFKIRLKSLLDEALSSELSNYVKEDRLSAFIQRCIEQQQQELSTRSNLKNNTISHDDDIIPSNYIHNMPIYLDEIKNINRAKTVLLLDGYDEIEHLNRGSHVVRELISRIFEYPNIVITSRPNAVTSVMEDRLERKIEATGLGHEGVDQYISRYFNLQSQWLSGEVDTYLSSLNESSMPKNPNDDIKFELLHYYEKQGDIKSKEILTSLEATDKSDTAKTALEIKQSINAYYKGLQQTLLKIYYDNPVLRDTLITPINLAMICLISTDQDILEKFKGDFNAGGLYEGVVLWLGKRYLTKFREKEAKDILDAIDILNERIFNLDELVVLQKAAYNGFKINKVTITGSEIDKLAHEINKTLGIRQVNKYGLLKPENSKSTYSLETWVYGSPEDKDIKPKKLYLYLDKDKNNQLSYALLGKNGIARVDITEDNRLGDSLVNIKSSLIKHKKDFEEKDKQALSEFLLGKGYAVAYENITKFATTEALEAQDLIHRNHGFSHFSFQEYLTAHNLKQQLMNDSKEAVQQAANLIAEHRNEPRYLMTLKFLSGIVTNEQGPKAALLVTRFWEAVTCNVDGVLELGVEVKIHLLMHILAQATIDGELDQRIPNLKKIQELIDVTVLKDITQWEEPIIQSRYLSDKMHHTLLAAFDSDNQIDSQVLSSNYIAEKNISLSKTLLLLSQMMNHASFDSKVQKIVEIVSTTLTSSHWNIQLSSAKCLEALLSTRGAKIDTNVLKSTVGNLIEAAKSNMDVGTVAINILHKVLRDEVLRAIPGSEHIAKDALVTLCKTSVNQVASKAFGELVVLLANKLEPEVVAKVFSELVLCHKYQNSRIENAAKEALAQMLSGVSKFTDEVINKVASTLGELIDQQQIKYVRSAVKELFASFVSGACEKLEPKTLKDSLLLLIEMTNDGETYQPEGSYQSYWTSTKTDGALKAEQALDEIITKVNNDTISSAASKNISNALLELSNHELVHDQATKLVKKLTIGAQDTHTDVEKAVNLDAAKSTVDKDTELTPKATQKIAGGDNTGISSNDDNPDITEVLPERIREMFIEVLSSLYKQEVTKISFNQLFEISQVDDYLKHVVAITIGKVAVQIKKNLNERIIQQCFDELIQLCINGDFDVKNAALKSLDEIIEKFGIPQNGNAVIDTINSLYQNCMSTPDSTHIITQALVTKIIIKNRDKFSKEIQDGCLNTLLDQCIDSSDDNDIYLILREMITQNKDKLPQDMLARACNSIVRIFTEEDSDNSKDNAALQILEEMSVIKNKDGIIEIPVKRVFSQDTTEWHFNTVVRIWENKLCSSNSAFTILGNVIEHTNGTLTDGMTKSLFQILAESDSSCYGDFMHSPLQKIIRGGFIAETPESAKIALDTLSTICQRSTTPSQKYEVLGALVYAICKTAQKGIVVDLRSMCEAFDVLIKCHIDHDPRIQKAASLAQVLLGLQDKLSRDVVEHCCKQLIDGCKAVDQHHKGGFAFILGPVIYAQSGLSSTVLESGVNTLIEICEDQGNNERVRGVSACSLGQILARGCGGIIGDDVIKSGFDLLFKLCLGENPHLRCESLFTLGKIVAEAHEKLSKETTIRVFDSVMRMSADQEDTVKSVVSKVFTILITESKSALSDKMIEDGLDVLLIMCASTSAMVRDTSLKAVESLCKEPSCVLSLRILKSSSNAVKEIAAISLLQKISALQPIETIDLALKIIQNLTNVHDTSAVKQTELLKVAIGSLYSQVKYVDDMYLIAINEPTRFDSCLSSPEGKWFLKKLYHQVLSNQMSKTESVTCVVKDFIIHCIQAGMNASITRDGYIDGYKLIYDHNVPYIEEITTAILNQRNPLSEQYKSHEPLLINSSSGIVKAASDVHDSSIINNRELVSNKWQISLLHLSNHQKQEPSKVFILLEKRDEFGYHVIHKIHIMGNKLNDEIYVKHPSTMQDIDFLKEVFDPMEYINTKPRYYGSVFEISQEAGQALIKKVKSVSIDITTKGSEYDVLHALLSDYLLEQNISISDNLKCTWSEYVPQSTVQTFGKAELQKIDNALVRRDSADIGLLEVINDHTVQLTKHEQRLQIHSKAITDMKGVQNLLESVTEKMLEDIAEDKELSAQEKAKRHEEIKSLDQSVKGIVTKVNAQEPIMQEITSEMKDLLIRKGTDTKTFITLYKKVKGIEEQLTNPSIPKVSMLHQADDQEGVLCGKVRIFSQGVSRALSMLVTEDELILN